ncbi:MAG TPA: hypothetical protein VJL59_10280 [Anaerolineales bacterium]|nr:hypothetical protein [Anaerolineales bacterium]
MIAFCTYCSRQKSAEAGNIPAIRRYQSERIAKVHRVTQEVGVQFLILSGEFGLLRPEHPIPDYDHLLIAAEVGALAEKLAAQLQSESVSGIVYFTQPFSQDPNVVPYHDALAASCARIQAPFLTVVLNETGLNMDSKELCHRMPNE